MVSLHEHEYALVITFVLPEKQQDYLNLLADPAGRKRALSQLPHWADLDERSMRRLSDSYRRAAQIESLLRQRGAPPTCYLLSEDVDLDGREMDLREALEEIVGLGAGTIVSCKPGRLAYYETEDPEERYLLER